MNYMKTSMYGKYAIMQRESLSLKAYHDGESYSIGFGHNGPDVSENDVICPYEATRLFEVDLPRYEQVVNKYVEVPLKQQQFDALVSFVYNIGETQFTKSTLLAKLNKGDDIVDEWLKWKYVHKGPRPIILESLVKRRKEEIAQFMG